MRGKAGMVTTRLLAWDISAAVFSQAFSVAGEETSPRSMFISGDGSRMYVAGDIGKDVNQYSLSTAWDISTASYIQNYSVASQIINEPAGLFFKPDGTQMYVAGSSPTSMYSYSLGTAWDISTASYAQSFAFSSQNRVSVQPHAGLFFRSDGMKMYACGAFDDDLIEYSLSTAWDISTASYAQSFVMADEVTAGSGVFFKPDGLRFYVPALIGDDINEYALGVAWDVSTATYVRRLLVTAQETSPYGIVFKPDGTKLYFVGDAGNDVNEYALGAI